MTTREKREKEQRGALTHSLFPASEYLEVDEDLLRDNLDPYLEPITEQEEEFEPEKLKVPSFKERLLHLLFH